MATSSEDVLQMVNHVRHKKNDGTLYVMAERIAWMLEDKDTFSISHKYADIKMQKISPDGKPKVQLQVVLNSGETTTFHFVNPLGSEAQLQDRNNVKELLQQLLPKFKRKVNKELEEKNKILAEDPVLFQLYMDLVVSQVITSEEFWANFTKCKTNVKNSIAQEVGISAAFLADIKPQTDGCNGLKYNITADIIDSIFRTYPAVKKKHMENVPHKISESEFWTRFFQSHYFHRDRLNISSKDLFSECAKSDEQDIERAIQDGIRDPFVDISSFEDYNIDESCANVPDGKSTAYNANQSMIRRFNHHSMMVLHTCSTKKSQLLEENSTKNSPSDPGKSLKNGVLNSNFTVNSVKNKTVHLDTTDSKVIKKARLGEKTEYEDLQGGNNASVCSLNLSKIDRYLHGPTPVCESDYVAPEEIIYVASQLNSNLYSWKPMLPQVLAPSAAIGALGELLPGGILMKNTDGSSLKDTVPVEVQNELKQLYSALTELLRHFWSCFPTTSPELEEKVIRMQGTLERFQYAKLQPFQDQLVRQHLPSQLTEHLMSLLQAAYTKFSNWQSRKLTLGKRRDLSA